MKRIILSILAALALSGCTYMRRNILVESIFASPDYVQPAIEVVESVATTGSAEAETTAQEEVIHE